MTAPRRRGLIVRLNAFFAANPDEELSLDDICTKFAAPKRSVYSRLQEHLSRPDCKLEKVSIVRLRK